MHHALETLVSFIAAAIQSPRLLHIWVSKASNNDLNQIAKMITEAKDKIPTWKGDSYPDLSIITSSILQNDKSILDGIDYDFSEEFCTLWRTFISDFLSEKLRSEYNSLKHCMRVGKSGFSLKINTPHDQKEHTTPGPGYGLSFVHSVKFEHGESVYEKNLYTRREMSNWSPINTQNYIGLICSSIEVVLAYVSLVTHTSKDKLLINLQIPENKSAFSSMHTEEVDIPHVSIEFKPDAAQIPNKEKTEKIINMTASKDKS